MKLQFEPDLDYQHDAIEAVCDLFRGPGDLPHGVHGHPAADGPQIGSPSPRATSGSATASRCSTTRSSRTSRTSSSATGSRPRPLGVRRLHRRDGDGHGQDLRLPAHDLRAQQAVRLHKFVIVVPSVAIKEGVYKTLQITEDHFRGLYADTPFDYFLYDSRKLGQVRNFATSPHIQIMVVTVGAINKKDVNNLYKDSEKTGGEKPIDLMGRRARSSSWTSRRASTAGSGHGQEALDAMNPLCTLRYSATHVDKHHMVYRLDAVDAYERKLVKQIEVASATVEGAHNKPYVGSSRREPRRCDHGARSSSTFRRSPACSASRSHGRGRRRPRADDGPRACTRTTCVGEICAAAGDQYMSCGPRRRGLPAPGRPTATWTRCAIQRR